jgi:type VI protein secretion system component Hcp
MKKFSVFFLFMCAVIYGNAQVSVYVKFTLYSGSLVDENPSSATHKGQILLTTISGGIEQSTTIAGSGAGTGRVSFDLVTYSKPVSINSAQLFGICAAGTRIKTVEISYYDSNDKIIYRQRLGAVIIHSYATTAASCANGCPGVIENISLDYTTDYISTYGTPGGTPTSFGWNVVTNTEYNDPN